MAKQYSVAMDSVSSAISDWLELSDTATEFTRTHPREARLAMVVALETAAAQFDSQEAFDDAIPIQLKPFLVSRPSTLQIIGVKEAAERLQVSRPTVYDWIDRKILLAWQSTKRGWNIPAEQIQGSGQVVEGIASVLSIIDDAELAWSFLTEQWPFADEVMRPLDKLKLAQQEAVIGAAKSFGMTPT